MNPNFDTPPGEYAYQESQYGKSAYGVLKAGPQSARNIQVQRQAGGEERQAADHGGHLIPHAAGGENTERNIDAQAANVNQRGVRHTERQALEASQKENQSVFYSVENYNSPGHARPDATMITVAVRDEQTGRVDVVYESMSNAQYSEQEKWDAELEAFEKSQGVEDQYEYLTPQERNLANEYADVELKSEIDTLGDWDHISFSQVSPEQDGMEAGLLSDMDSGMDGSFDGGFDGGADGGFDGGADGSFDGGFDGGADGGVGGE